MTRVDTATERRRYNEALNIFAEGKTRR